MTTQPQPVLESHRLILRSFELSDAIATQLLAGDIRVAKETMNIPHPYEDGIAEKWIDSLGAKWRDRKEAHFAIVAKENEALIGCVGFVEIDGDVGEIGYWIGVPYWGKGYCSEAASCLLRFGWKSYCFTKMKAMHLASNPASGAVLKKLGMIATENKFCKDRYGDFVRFELYETPTK